MTQKPDLIDFIELEKAMRGLLRGEHASLTLTFNDENAPSYQTVEQAMEGVTGDVCSLSEDWVSPEERALGVKLNSVWTLHWYPDTPVGFYRLRASSLAALFEGLKEHKNAE